MADASTNPSGGSRVQNRERVRSRLAGAAIRLFAQQGFAETTVDEIAEAADVSRRTLFRHFPTKADIVFADHPERINRLQRYLDAPPADTPPLDVVFGAALATVPSFIDPPEFFLARHRLLRHTPELRNREQAYGLRYGAVLARCLKQRLADETARDESGAIVSDGVIADVVSASIVTVVNRAQRAWAASGGTTDPTEETQQGLHMLRAAFTPLLHGTTLDAASSSPTVIVMNATGTVPQDIVDRLNSILADDD